MNNTPIIPDNSTLSISSPTIKNCNEVAQYFLQAKIPCHVISNVSVVNTNTQKDSYAIEPGCQIKFGSHHPYLINSLFWSKLQKRFGLTCAHLHIEGKYKGCIYNYLRQSNCPQ